MIFATQRYRWSQTAIIAVSRIALFFLVVVEIASACKAQDLEHATFNAARDAAKSKGTDIIVFVHGSDWNPYGEQIRKTAWEDPSFRLAIADLAQMMRINDMENPTEADKKDKALRTKNFPINQFKSYPLVCFFDPDGTYYKSLSGDSLPSNRDEFTQAVVTQLKARRMRDQYLSQAESEPDLARKTELLFQGYQLGTGKSKQFKDAIQKADPNDTQGFLSILNFNGQTLVTKATTLAKEGKANQALEMLANQLANRHLLPEQRQWVLLAKLNTYRYVPNSLLKVEEIADQSGKVSKTSIPGRAIEVIANRYARQAKKK